MKVFWLNERLTLEPENPEESTALDVLSKAVLRGPSHVVGTDHQSESGPVDRFNDEKLVV
jgi:hypothetical protein